ncbi:MAG: leucine-rich repeat domain-containing protein [Oscillospiraceae bacterium]|nr:leucine-rich repeat domain-containing protein [Oscillospiraceae bacterium]
MKRFLSVLLLVFIVAGICTVSAWADTVDSCKEGCLLAGNEHDVCVVPDMVKSPSPKSSNSGTWGGIDWSLSADGTLTISPSSNPVPDKDCGKQYASGVWREAVIYNSKGEAVKELDDTPYNKAEVKRLIIEEGVTSIGSFVLRFSNLTGEVVIPSTVTYIGQEAFQRCNITKLTFAPGGTGELCIAPGAFKSLSITDLVLPYNRPEVHIHCWAFNDCTSLENVVLPANITTFSQWTHVDYIGDMNYVNSSDSQVFARCYNIKTMTFGSEEVKDLFFNAQYNQSNVNAFTSYPAIYVDPDAGKPAAPPAPPAQNDPVPGGAAPVTPTAPVVENVYYIPSTDDNSNMALWSILALALLSTAFVTRKRKNEN